MPPYSRVIIFEDDPFMVENMQESLANEGHTVLFVADSIEKLEKLLPTITDADVALLDNQAPWKTGQAPDYKGVGKIAEKRIRGILGERVITVATTSDEHPNYGEHIFTHGITQTIGEFVTALPRKERQQ